MAACPRLRCPPQGGGAAGCAHADPEATPNITDSPLIRWWSFAAEPRREGAAGAKLRHEASRDRREKLSTPPFFPSSVAPLRASFQVRRAR